MNFSQRDSYSRRELEAGRREIRALDPGALHCLPPRVCCLGAERDQQTAAVEACCHDPVAAPEREPVVVGACCQYPVAARGQGLVAAPEEEPVAVPPCSQYPIAAQNSETSSLR